MAVKALNITDTKEFISKHDDARTEADGATVWVIGALDSATMGRIRDSSTVVSMGGDDAEDGRFETAVAMNRMNAEAVAAGLRGFRNFLDPVTSDAVTYKTVERDFPGGKRRVVHPDVMRVIPLDVIADLAAAVRGFNEAAEGEPGN